MKYLSFSFVFLVALNSSLSQSIYGQLTGREYWHSQLSSYLNIRTDRLKLSQGALIVENQSYWLWNMFNAMSGYDSGIYYNPSQYNQFSSGYMTVLYNYPVSDTFDPECHINNAILKFKAARDTYAWDKSIHDLHIELAEGRPFVLKSDTTIRYCSADDTTYSYTIKIEAQYEQMVVFYSNPYSNQKDEESNYSPWYTPCVLKKSYLDSIHWESTFGPNGFMQNICVALIVAQNGSTNISVLSDVGDFSDSTTSTVPIVIAVVIFTIKDFILNPQQ